MKYVLLVYLLSFCTATVMGTKKYHLADRDADESVIKLVERLHALNKRGILFGHEDATAYGIGWKYHDKPGCSDIKEVCGDLPAVFGWDLGHLEIDSPANLDSVDFDLMRHLITEAHEKGGIITISWHLNNPVNGGSSWTKDETVKYILPGRRNYDIYKNWVEKVALFLHSLKDGRGNSIPVIFRPFHEMNGDWFWWGTAGTTPEDYKHLWRSTVRLLRDELNVHNVLYAYSPNSFMTSEALLRCYPGDNWVDILGMDIYDRDGDPDKYVIPLVKGLEVLAAVAREKGKLYAITETGRDSVADEHWWSGVLYPNIQASGISYVLVWRNAWQTEHYAPYAGHKSAPDFREFYNLKDILFLKDIQ